MTIGRARASVLVAGVIAALLSASSARAAITGDVLKCVLANAKASQKYTIAKLKLIQKCKNANLKDGSCTSPDPAALSKLSDKLTAAIGKSCALVPVQIALAGFPGPCTDPTPGDDFTTADLQTCMQTAHDGFVTSIMNLAYDSTLVGPLVQVDDLKCQAEIGKQTAGLAACVLKNVSKCRDALLKGKPLGVPPDFCALNDAKTSAAIQKCKDKVTAGIAKKCTTPQITTLKVCTPDQTDAAGAASCLNTATNVLLDGPEIIVPPDAIDYEYAVRGGLCGDNVVNNLNEECDGPDDSACPGQCGTAEIPDGFFACLCKTKPRMVVIEHANADTDNGWTGISSDGDVVEGGGFLVDLYDCDISGLCNAGPSCSIAPHSPCSVPESAASGTTSDSICAGLGQGTCRKERTATGPHCFVDIQKKCDAKNPNDPVCNGPNDYCATSFHGAPVAQAAGGVAVCNVSVFSEDVVGTVNILTGTSSLKVRQRAVVRGPITQNKPCPICGNFCAINRAPCNNDGDCALGQGPCIEEKVCSDGLRKDKLCRQTAPFAGAMPFFGISSMDCPPSNPPEIQYITAPNGTGLDINANPRTTGSVSLPPSFNCTDVGYNTKTCLGGTSEGRPCTVASECPGGTCTGQCFCSGQKRPNACGPACVGGGSDALSCANDADCPGGFCHPADCRVDPGDTDSNQEGVCTNSPPDQFCALTPIRGCDDDSDCQPSTACPYCTAGDTCELRPRACFVNSGIVRTGTPGSPDRETAAIYCVPSNGGAIDISAGFAGPGALIQRETVMVVP